MRTTPDTDDRPAHDDAVRAMTGLNRRWRPRILWVPLLFLPVVDLLANGASPLRTAVALLGFVAYMVLGGSIFRHGIASSAPPHLIPMVVFLTADVTALTVLERPSWGTLYPPLCIAVTRLPERWRIPAVLGLSALATAAASTGGVGNAISVGGITFGVGLMVMGMRRLAETNIELHAARTELARAAVSQERERFARDLHDLLGHSLSVIALKAELAGRLLPDRADEAQTHVADVESVARDALREVRDAVGGYRRPVLSAEIDGARMALEAAGIALEVGLPDAPLSPEAEAVLAWTVREGTTNVIRHSRARHCRIVAAASPDEASVAVEDDGPGGAGGATEGNGLTGLRERVLALDGHVVAGPRSDDGTGFRLHVSVPA